MQYHIKEHGKYVEITGFKNIQFTRAEAFLKQTEKTSKNVELQFFDARINCYPTST